MCGTVGVDYSVHCSTNINSASEGKGVLGLLDGTTRLSPLTQMSIVFMTFDKSDFTSQAISTSHDTLL